MTTPSVLFQAFAAALEGAGHAVPAGDTAALDEALLAVVAAAGAASPKLAFAPEAFAAHLARRRPAGMPLTQFLHVASAADLLLAFCCGHGDAEAIRLFDARFDGDLRMVYAQGRGHKPPFDEYAQVLRSKLMTGEQPRILAYAGVGELKNWVRVTASRVLVDLQRAASDAQPLHEEAVLAVPSPDDDPEIDYLKRLYRAEMREAFEAAVNVLSPEERNCLRDYYARGLSVDELAAARGIHRATAARRVAAARSAVLKHTRQLLMQRTQLSRDELESVVRLIESQLYVTVERVFAVDA